MTERDGAVQVVSISADERMRLEAIVMDADGREALAFLKEILKRLRESESKGMRTRLRP